MTPNCLRALALLAALFPVLLADVIDPAFRTGTGPVTRGPDGPVFAMTRHPDGWVIIAGDFVRVNGQRVGGIARLLPDGSLDPAFAPSGRPDGPIRSVAALPDGRVLIGGEFGHWGDQPAASHLVRLLPDGARDESLVESTGWEGSVTQIEVLADDDFVVLGRRREDEMLRPFLQHRLEDGSVDRELGPPASDDSTVNALVRLTDGSLLVAGRFNGFGGHSVTNLVRLLQDGAVDTTFAAPPAAEARELYAVAVATDGRIAIGGAATNIGPTMFLAVLTPEGTQENEFATNSLIGSPVSRLAFDAVGTLLVSERGDGGTEFELASAFTPLGLKLDMPFSPARFGSAPLPLPDGGALWPMWGSRDHGGNLRSWLIRTMPDGAPDPAFIPGLAGDPLLPFQVRAFALMPDGDLIVPGRLVASPDSAWDQELLRLTENGSPRTNFVATVRRQSQTTDNVSRLVGNKTGQIYIAGGFGSVNGDTNHPLMTLLLPDGSVDQGFNHAFMSPNTSLTRETVFHDLELLGDGRFFAGGRAWLSNTLSEREMVVSRFQSDGRLDATFKPLRLGSASRGPHREVTALTALSPDRVLVWGRLQQSAPPSLFEYDALGQVQAGPTFLREDGLTPDVRQLSRQRDGRVLVAGSFSRVGDSPRRNLVRLLPDLTVDSSFDTGEGPNSTVSAVAELSDGRILAGGSFTRWDGGERRRLVLLETNGQLANGFDPGTGPDDMPLEFAEQPDGRVLMSGSFANVDGRGPGRLARLVVPTANPPVPPQLVTQPQNTAFTNLSLPTLLSAAAYGSAPLRWQWFRDGLALQEGDGFTGVGSSQLTIARDHLVEPASYHVEVSNDFGRERSVNVVAGMASGTLDYSFTTNLLTGQLRLSTTGSMRSYVTQMIPHTGSDGQVRRVLIIGAFNRYDGATVPGLVVVFPDGRRDESWMPPPGVTGQDLMKAAFFPDGRLVGEYSRANGAPRDLVMRLLPNGTLDEGFDPGTELTTTPPPGFPKLESFTAMALDETGVYLAQRISRYGAFVRRLGADGRTDTNFTTISVRILGHPSVLAIQPPPQSGILVGGLFFGAGPKNAPQTMFSGMARLHPNGELDTNFNANPRRPFQSADGEIRSLIPMPDGGAFIAGFFTEFDGATGPVVRVDRYGRADTNVMVHVPGSILRFRGSHVSSATRLDNDSLLLHFRTITTSLPDQVVRMRFDGQVTATFGAIGSGTPVWLGDGSYMAPVYLPSTTIAGRLWLTELSAIPRASAPPRVFGPNAPLVHTVQPGFNDPLVLSVASQVRAETRYE
jgi:uncharacterized delta-60 repeat protein